MAEQGGDRRRDRRLSLRWHGESTTGSARSAAAPDGRGLSVPHFACHPARDVLRHVEATLDPRSLLSPAESARSSRLTPPRGQEDFLAARVLARLLLRHLHRPDTGLTALADFVITQQCPRCGGPHGRPVVDVPGTAVSWAHSRGYVAAAIGPGSVGVDVEPADTRSEHVPSSGTAQSWVRSEAIIKWGHGAVDAAGAWQPHLGGSASRRGRRYVIDAAGLPRKQRLLAVRAPAALVLTDAPVDAPVFVCSVAGPARAQWVDDLLG